jgi:hypothetical protein
MVCLIFANDFSAMKIMQYHLPLPRCCLHWRWKPRKSIPALRWVMRVLVSENSKSESGQHHPCLFLQGCCVFLGAVGHGDEVSGRGDRTPRLSQNRT